MDTRVWMQENEDKGKEIVGSIYDRVPFPVCVVSEDDVVLYANCKMKEVFAYDDIAGSNFFALTGIKRRELTETEEGEERENKIRRNDQVWVLEISFSKFGDEDLVVYFINVTEREELRTSLRDEHLCQLYINIDNYDELIQSGGSDNRMAVPTEVDRILRNWAEKYNGAIESIAEDSYLMSVYRRDADAMIEGKFQILDEIRNIKTKIDFPVSISIGMGMGGTSLRERTELAEAALELALGRGGDQAVVKTGNRTHFYGGKFQSMEKNNKGKSRVIAHALKQLILESENVIIMGHMWPDMDSFGAAIGAYKIAESFDKDVYIVLEQYNEALEEIYKQAETTEDYELISRAKAVEYCTENTLLIVVDTHRPNMTECPELLSIAGKRVVIDHHRLSEDSIEFPTLSYVESYASSTSELMTEILQYTSNKKLINKFEAEALLAGITVDTNSFSIKTGVRTFEAAAWLRKAGADTTEVKRFFQTEVSSFQMKADAVARAEYLENGIAFAISEGYSTDAQIINAQVADELLMVKGVKAVFAVGKNDQLKTVISARSLGDINVQVVMEHFHGGGHLTSAGAQVDLSPEEVIDELKRILPNYVDEKKDKEENEQE